MASLGNDAMDYFAHISGGEIVRVLCRKLAVSRKKFEAMLASALKVGCFDKKLYQRTGRLTSPGIKRRAKTTPKYTPETVQRTIPETIPITPPITTPETPQRKEKESKEKRIPPPTPSTRGVSAGESLEYNAGGDLDHVCLTGSRNAVREQGLQAWLMPNPLGTTRQTIALWLSPMARGPDKALWEDVLLLPWTLYDLQIVETIRNLALAQSVGGSPYPPALPGRIRSPFQTVPAHLI